MTGFSGSSPIVVAVDQYAKVSRKPTRPVFRPKLLPMGFTPIPNRRIDAAIAKARELLDAAGCAAETLDETARRLVASTLPALPFRHRYRRPKPSKSDDAAYRRGSR